MSKQTAEFKKSANDTKTPAGKLNLLPPAERELLINTWNATQCDYPSYLCIHQLFEAQVARTPDAPALVHEDQTLSYAQLNARANRLAHRLIQLGVVPDARVAICVTRSPAMVVGLLAILKAGGAYVPLDPAYPSERLVYILADAAPTIVLADETGHAALGQAALACRTVLDPNELPPRADANPQVPSLTARHLAYVIYTSGSTGTPKGVMVEHRNVTNFLTAMSASIGIASHDRLLAVTSIAFDIAGLELYLPMSQGAMIVMASRDEVADPVKLQNQIIAQKISLMQAVPSVWRTLLDLPGPTLDLKALCGGEALSSRLSTQLRLATRGVWNLYGPTETTIWSSIYRISKHRDTNGVTAPIGRPIANTRVYLLDAYGQPVPLGAAGELYIGGDGVARGYLNRPELTAERFVPDPFSDVPDARMYKTGDLARYLPDGNLEFLGRNDYQVKIRGFRIEPGEIEACLLAHPQVRDTVVLARGEDHNTRLIAYTIADPDDSLASTLRAHAAAHLPEYMVPSAFVRLDAFPLTPNGKLDRRALPAPDDDALVHQAYEAPQGELETTLAAIWAELLGVERVGRHDSFFALGGHSLLAVRLIERLRHLGLAVSVRAVFDSPTLGALAQCLDTYHKLAVPLNQIAPDTTTLTPDLLPLIDLNQSDIDRIVEHVPGGVPNIQDIYALSPLQDGILFHHLLATDGDPYLLVAQMAFKDRALLDCYLNAVQQVVDRHDILRTAFVWEGLSTPAQVVWRHAPLSITELTLDPANGPITEQLAQCFDPRQHRLDLTQAPLLRFVTAQDSNGRWLLLQLLHHLIGDHSTLDVMHTEVQAFVEGRGQTLPPAQPFRNLIAQARLGMSQEAHKRFFTEMLADVDEPTLPFGLTDVLRDGDQVTESHRMLPPALNDRLRAQAKRMGVSLASLCHLAWAQVLARASGNEQIVFGTVLFGRMQAGDSSDSAMGLFINTLPLRVDLNGGVKDSVRSTHACLAALLEHEHASLVLAQRCSGVPTGAPLFSALLNYRHNTMPSGELSLHADIELLSTQERTNYPMALAIDDFGQALGLTVQVVQPLDPNRLCGYMQQALDSLVKALEHTPSRPTWSLGVLPDNERELLLQTWNATKAPYPQHQCIHQLFEAQVARTPDAIALVHEDQTLSYAQLNARANRLAHQLIQLGVVPDARVAICVARSPAMVVGLLAILKAGGAYVPLDPAYPCERLAYILADAAPAIVLADETGHAALGQAALACCTVLDPNVLPPRADANPQVPSLTARHLAYVIYTSGSTGTPKGVMVEHRNLTNLCVWHRHTFDLQSGHCSATTAGVAFDASVWELWPSLVCGGIVSIPPRAACKDAQALLQWLRQQHLETTFLVTPLAAMALADQQTPAGLRHLLTGGDRFPYLTRVLPDELKLVNNYGPTEATVVATSGQLSGQDKCPHIGRPIANTRVYLLDAYGQPVPLGAAGELHIGGDGVARGYLNRPELTAERFVPDPFSDVPDARMYKTGDLARYLPDGNLEFLGRNDYQVKIRGFRIEPGEIEACLLAHPQVHDTVVLARGEDHNTRLIAYTIADPDDSLASTLRAHAAAHLPEYMVPSAFVRLDAFPLTPNGKLDRRALPAPDDDALVHQAYEAPQGELETTLAAIWAELLGVERVGRHDSFFALGGHSLLAVRLINRVTTLGANVPLATLFASPTLAAFTAAIRKPFNQEQPALPAITPVPHDNHLPLSFAQQRLWFLAQLEDVSDTYHIPMALSLRGCLDKVAWQQALNALFARHEALRSTFVAVDGQPQVQLLPADKGVPLRWHDLRGIPDADAQLAQLSSDEVHASFDLTQGPLVRARMIQLADDEYRFLLTQHHIVSDGWSLGVLVRELSTLYATACAGQPNPLPPLAIQYPDYAAWQRQWLSGERLQHQSDYWRTTLAEAPVLLELPTDRPRPAQQSFAGAHVPVRIDAPTTRALKRLSREHDTTLFMTVLAAWSAVLSRLSGQHDLVIGTPSANRNHQAIEPLIGFFVNMLALRIDLSDEPDIAQLLQRVQRSTLAAQAHQELPFEKVVEIVQPPRRLNHTPLFQVVFSWQNKELSEWHLPNINVVPVTPRYDVVKFDLELNLQEENDEIIGNLSYATALFDPLTIERHVGYLQVMLRAMVTDTRQPIVSVDILAPAERELLLQTWNATEAPYPQHQCIHQLFEAQVARTPDAIALVHEDQTLSYAQLNARANRLAHQLIQLGVVPDARVAICVTRSPAMVVGLLAILKAGGAYVPLDPAYPCERLAHILADAAPAIVLADETGHAALGQAALACCTVLDPNVLPPRADANPQVPSLTARHLAYVIYTSGSTGTPKGVMVEHRNLTNLCVWHRHTFDLQSGHCSATTAGVAFDASVWELWPSLVCGGIVSIPPRAACKDAQALLQWLRQQHLETTFLVTPLAAMALADQQTPAGLRHLLTGGDRFPYLTRVLPDELKLVNNYGPTEATVVATSGQLSGQDKCPHIGRPIANTRVYLLDAYGQPVPLGAAGELHIGGDGVARGYLNRPELTAERFVPDPFSDVPDARMYKTGDLARYLPDGNLEFLGRNDYQVKIRGFRIEPGEIEACLLAHPQVHDTVVLARGEDHNTRLIAYTIADPDDSLASTLRAHAAAHLPEYMVPSAFVRLDAFPLTPNGKLDRRALPAPDDDALVHQAYEAPQGELETTLAAIWAELLGVERVGRHDSFFALGGHSLLAVRLIERLRHLGLAVSVRAVFDSPTLGALAQCLDTYHKLAVPLNQIAPDTTTLTPDLLPLIDLNQSDIDRIVEHVPGGVPNIQDIYALSPLQDGILFHHLLATDGDPYLLIAQMAFKDRALLDCYLNAVQQVVDRHDILRTAFVWEGLSTPAQVVWRHAPLSITELTLDPANGPITEQLARCFDPRQHRLDLTQAPLLRFVTAQDSNGRWLLLQLLHHLIGDHSTLDVMHTEVQAFVEGRGQTLPPAQPFRNLIAQARLGMSQEAHKRFFTEMLADVDEPTLPFGLTDVLRDGDQVTESHRMLPQALNDRLRAQAKRMGVSLASLCHLAWAQVLARAHGNEQIVFGTVLFGRMHAGDGAASAMGLYINTLPLRVDLDGNVENSVRATHARLAALLEHEHASLALAQRCSALPAGTPLFSALLNYRHNAMPPGERHLLPGIELLNAQECTNYPLTLSVEDFGQALELTAQVGQPLDPGRVCEYMRQALESLAEELEARPGQPVRQLEVLPDEERTLLLQMWNATRQAYPSHLCIHQLFEAQVERTSEATALVLKDQTFSYAELNAQANRLAHQLIEWGVRPDTRVAICVQRSPALVVGLLAILKAGGAYVPLDPNYPGERLAHILTDAAPSIVLADAAGRAALGEAALAECTVLDPSTLPALPDTNPSVAGLTARHLAYVIYTSGSTGTPKGVMVPHHAIARLVINNGFVDIRTDDRVAFAANPAFDASTFEVWAPLLNGATVVVIDHDTVLMPAAFAHTLREQRISILWLTVGLFNQMVTQVGTAFSQLKALIVGGDVLDARLIAQVMRESPPEQLLNGYGPTESTTFATTYKITSVPEENASIPIGRPIGNTRIYLLDANGQPVPLGAVGELYIGGDGVARGYLNRPELTAERFVPDPFSNVPDARMYKTGDLARYLPDGNLAYLGRNDHQVKIRGFRIEPGEIEACLAQHPQVRDAVVLARGKGNDKRLVAYLVADADEQLASTLRAHAAAHLPEYMVPSAFVRLDAFPLTPNGKLDRRALPAPDDDALVHQAYEAPQGELETTLAAIWAELLGVERVGRHDSFFALGGHSLLAVRLIERLRSLGLSVSVRVLFDTLTLSALAQCLNQCHEEMVPPNAITPEAVRLTPDLLPLIDLNQSDIDRIVEHVPGGVPNIQDIYALSPLQDGILFHHLLATDGDPYLLVAQMAFKDRALLDCYLNAVQQVVDRHDILRTAFVWEGLSTPAQVVWRHAPLSITELTLDPANGPITEQLARCFDPRQHRLDLTQAPLLRFVTAQDSNGRWLLLQLSHHLIIDHSTLDVMRTEMQAFLEGWSNMLPPAQPFRNLIARTRLGISQAEHERFFIDQLADVDEPTLPFGLTEVHRDGAHMREAHRMLPQALNNRLRAHAKRLGVSLASLCHLAWAQVLARASGQQRVVFGTVLFGRMHAGDGAASAMGLYINTLPLRVNLDGSVEDSVRATHARLAALLEHEHASLALAQRCSSVPAGTPLFSTILNYRHNAMPPGEHSMLSGIKLLQAEERTNYPLMLSIEDFRQELGLIAQVMQTLDPDRVCGYMQQALESLAEALEVRPERSVRQLEVLPDKERTLLLQTWNATQRDYPSHRCVHQLFEEQVATTPEVIALTFKEQRISYTALNAQANRLAHRLIRLGVVAETPVAVLMQRSPERVVTALAILKAGGVYMPLNEQWPDSRLHTLLGETRAPIVLTDRPLQARCDAFSAHVIAVDADASLAQEPSDNPTVACSPEQLAYLMYTSGSTGQPKGAGIVHRTVRYMALDRRLSAVRDRVLLHSSHAFDVSTYELWTPLLCGGQAVIVPPGELDVHVLQETIRAHQVSALWLSAGLFQVMAEGDLSYLRSVRQLTVGGDIVSAAAAQRVLEHCPTLRFINGYGPTETTIATCHLIEAPYQAQASMPIGTPLDNATAYVLDACLRPAPVGVVGELYIAGEGVARGYFNRPGLTAERFIAHPFDTSGARLYRTGDLAYWRSDGALEFIGRADQQVKIRGFRVEPGEIEAVLQRHPGVAQAAVIAREERAGDTQLVSYIVLDEAPVERDLTTEANQVEEWQKVYDTYYQDDADYPFGENFNIWKSSYDGQPIPLSAMQAWRADAVERIRALQPQRVLEIGVGTGLLLAHLAPHCDAYWGTDFSAPSIETLRAQLAQQPELASHVQLRTQAAHITEGLPSGYFDTIVINSVVQYFPSASYLMEVVRQAMDLLVPGGRVFIGDVRNLNLLNCFTTAVQLHQADSATDDRSSVERRIQQALLAEKELLLAPAFFSALPDSIDTIAAVDIELKRRDYDNELSRYRYDVVLRKGPVNTLSLAHAPQLRWGRGIVEIEALQTLLATERPAQLRITGVPNARLALEIEAMQALEHSDDIGLIQRQLMTGDAQTIGLEPEAFSALGGSLGYWVGITWSEYDALACMDVVFVQASEMAQAMPTDVYIRPSDDAQASPFSYANQPASFDPFADVRHYVATQLPDYMVPAAFVRLDALPLTPNGKLDRRALPAPDDDALVHQAYEAPQGELETTLAAIWAELLGVERVGRHDSFFALGGHSLLAVRLINRVTTLGANVPLATLFASPTLAAFTAAIRKPFNQEQPALPAITPVPHGNHLPLSFAQQRLWFLAQLEDVSDTYHIPMALSLRGCLDKVAWQQALNALFARHEALRSTFVAVDGQPQVQLLPADKGVPLCWHDLRGIPNADAQLAQLSSDEVHASFDLTQGPLVRARMIQLADDEYRFLLTQHHIVSDGWSLGVLVRELSTLYATACAGQPNPLPPLAIQYPDYAAWQRQWLSGERLQHQSDYWRTTLAEAPVLLELPTDRPRPAQQSFAGAHVPVRIDAPTTRALKRLSREHDTTLFMTVLAAWSAVLSRLSGQHDLVIGTPSANRNHQAIEPLIGFFVNMLALRIDLSDEPDIAQLLQRVQRSTLAAQAHQELPFEKVVEIVQPPRRLNHTPLFQVVFSWQNKELSEWHLPNINVVPVTPRYDVVKFDLELNLQEEDDEIIGNLSYATALFDPLTIERHVGYLQVMLRAMVTDTRQPIVSVDILAPAERELLLQTWNATEAPYPQHQCIHQLFEAQVARTPDAIALVHEDQTLSYAQLNARANRLAHQLIQLGVVPDARVAICVARSPAMVVGLLAILKAGGAYVPLDPAYPCERLAYILADAAPAIVLADETGHAALGQAALACCTVLDPNVLPPRADANPQVPSLTARHLAYVIYTSGSTGTPKGVQNEHRALINRLTWMQQAYGLTPDDRVLQKTSFSFDVSVWEFFWTLLNGATLVMAAPDTHKDPSALSDIIRQQYITTAHFVPSMLSTFLHSACVRRCTSVKRLICSGEALPAASVRLCQTLLPHAQLYNLYGPTEAAIDVTAWTCPIKYTGESVPIGRPIANTRVYLLDAYGQPVPLGAAGELHIGGDGVARGYLNRPELTAERFVPDPFSDVPDARMYKTGDLARYLPDGNLEFLGRNDYQVKIRGFRIEPGEIEACLLAHPQVRDTVVLARGEDHNTRLIAYTIADPDDSLASTLRAHAAAHLPEYMVPSAFVRLDAFPLTPNGKLDRRSLPVPDDDALVHQAYEAPQGELETTLAAIWAELLGVERVGRHDSFFALGGHSLLAVRLISRIRAILGIELNIRALLEAPTVAGLVHRSLQLDGTEDDSFDVLLPIKSTGNRPPLFCIHPVGGLSWHYRSLVNHLNTDQPVYGLQARGLNDLQPTAASIEAMASDYIKQIQRIQPSGPYHLLGWSFGGNVVHNMATQLEQQGEKIALLVLLDSYPDHTNHAQQNDVPNRDLYINYITLYGDNNLPEVEEYLWKKIQNVVKNNNKIIKNFSPSVYCGDMLFFRATIVESEAVPLISSDVWQPYVLGNIETYDIHCKHSDMSHPTPTAEIGQILSQKLDKLSNSDVVS